MTAIEALGEPGTVVRKWSPEIYFAEQTYLPEGVMGSKVECEFAIEGVDEAAQV